MASVTMGDLVDQWRRDLAVDRAAATTRRYGGAIQRFLTWYQLQEHRPLTLDQLTPIVLIGYRNALQQTAATSTINVHVCALRAFATWLTTAAYLAVNPAACLKLVGQPTALAPCALEAPQINALLRVAARSRHGARDSAIVQLLLQTGMRIGECAALAWADVRFSEKRGHVLIRAGKGNQARSVPLNASARQAIAEYVAPGLAVVPTLRAVASAWPGPSVPPTPLWRSQKGGGLSVSAMGRVIDGLVRDCAARQLVPADVGAHTLRHTFATRYLATHPGDLVGVASLLGHRSLDTTRLYLQPTEEQLAERIEKLDLNVYAG